MHHVPLTFDDPRLDGEDGGHAHGGHGLIDWPRSLDLHLVIGGSKHARACFPVILLFLRLRSGVSVRLACGDARCGHRGLPS